MQIFQNLHLIQKIYTPTPILTGKYNESIDHPDQFLDFGYAERVANPAQISAAVLAYAQQSDRIKVVEYGRTHENRPLYAVFISSPENIANLETIKANLNQLTDAETLLIQRLIQS